MNRLTWRGLEFEPTVGLDHHFRSGHWIVYKPKALWSAIWMDVNTYAVAIATTDDPASALEAVLQQLTGCLERERGRLDDLRRRVLSAETTCAALAEDLDKLGVPRSGE